MIFRASKGQRAVALLLAAATTLVSGYSVSLITPNLPRMLYQLKLAQSQGEATMLIWLSLVLACIAALMAGIVFLAALVMLALIEGTQVRVDELGVTVKCTLLPPAAARLFGQGHIAWENITKLERRFAFFVLQGQKDMGGLQKKTTIRFLMVDQLERLILLIIEHSKKLRA